MKGRAVIPLLLAACGGPAAQPDRPASPPDDGFEPPVMTNAASPVDYPEDLYAQRVEGTVVLRLFVDTAGRVVPDSTRLAESSGIPELDSAAVRGVADMRFAPARRDGATVAAAFLQPIFFRHPERSGAGGR